jgi:hypothetical protein
MMAKGNEYRIKKIEKGPLQRFKNQNLLLKKFGETGIQVYKAITGKRSTEELKKDLGVEDSLFDQIISFMHDSGMIELEPVSGEAKVKKSALAPEPVEEPESVEPEPEEQSVEEKTLEELPPAEETDDDVRPLEEKPARKKAKKAEEEMAFEEITPIDIEPEAQAADERVAKTRPSARRKKKVAEDEIEPVEAEGEPPESEETPSEEPPPEEAPEEVPEEGKEEAPEEGKEEAPEEGSEEPEKEEEISISAFEEEKPAESSENEMSPVEKIIFEKYGDLGLRAYSLIDGQRTAEEIMRETGLTEAKLVEMLDFMDEQGIIKLDYPKGQGAGGAGGAAPSGFSSQQQAAPSEAGKKEEGGFGPMIEGEDSLDEAKAIISPVETPIKAPLDIAKSLQMKVRIMLKYGDKGAKISESVDGKNDVLDISLKLNMPLYDVYDILRFMMESGMILMKPMSRADVRKKYGDDGYAVYKRYGKEGLMLYELIGKEMTIQQMADKITKDKAKIIDMFIFIHKVLGIELPIDRDMLAKQLGVTNLPPPQ